MADPYPNVDEFGPGAPTCDGAMVAVAKGRSPANHLVELDALIQRMTYQRGAGLAALRVEEVCPDGETVRHIGCGAAA